ncbi:MAG: hypothetical protein M3Y30_07645 [Gemmatimonadota bacterium]|nr:hypothetical protein [Gemmatimonadota bacterium]
MSEPVWALLTGGVAGALGFFLWALLFGARGAIVVAVVALIAALVKRMRTAAIAFVAGGALAAIGAATSTTVLFIASLTFGVGLALAARAIALTQKGDVAR